jgi:putative IMPACT (imprinted ancient) family translation regulator
MTKSFLTAAEPHSEQLIAERSRFVAYIENTPSAAAAQAFVDKISKRHFDATHNCFAYSISGCIISGAANMGAGGAGANTSTDGADINVVAPAQRFSDAGEPSGTAGPPILEAIKSKELSNVCIVVTRYFGGVKLGAPGLTRAYGRAARGVIEGAKIVRLTLCDLLKIKTAYTFLNSLNFLLEKKYGCKINEIIYDSDITVSALVPVDYTEGVIKEIKNITAGGCAAVVIDKNYFKLGD